MALQSVPRDKLHLSLAQKITMTTKSDLGPSAAWIVKWRDNEGPHFPEQVTGWVHQALGSGKQECVTLPLRPPPSSWLALCWPEDLQASHTVGWLLCNSGRKKPNARQQVPAGTPCTMLANSSPSSSQATPPGL